MRGWVLSLRRCACEAPARVELVRPGGMRCPSCSPTVCAVFVSTAAAEIDRLVVGGHMAVARLPARAAMLRGLPAQPGLLNSLAAVLLRGPVTRDEVGLVMAYT